MAALHPNLNESSYLSAKPVLDQRTQAYRADKEKSSHARVFAYFFLPATDRALQIELYDEMLSANVALMSQKGRSMRLLL